MGGHWHVSSSELRDAFDGVGGNEDMLVRADIDVPVSLPLSDNASLPRACMADHTAGGKLSGNSSHSSWVGGSYMTQAEVPKFAVPAAPACPAERSGAEIRIHPDQSAETRVLDMI